MKKLQAGRFFGGAVFRIHAEIVVNETVSRIPAIARHSTAGYFARNSSGTFFAASPIISGTSDGSAPQRFIRQEIFQL
jgi:hypothetical protein